MLRLFALTALAAAMVGHPVAACAHGAGSREMDPGAARVMEFLYADGEPMAFAQVRVTAPGGGVHQSAHADARGRFAFVPDGAGVWTVAAADGQGHRAVVDVTTVGGAAGPTAAGSPLASPSEGRSGRIGPGWREVALGLSLLANLLLWAAWRRGKAASPGRT
jgi:nickel transport protein